MVGRYAMNAGYEKKARLIFTSINRGDYKKK